MWVESYVKTTQAARNSAVVWDGKLNVYRLKQRGYQTTGLTPCQLKQAFHREHSHDGNIR
ncbi:MAG TPA: hypothetical protein V6D19_12190 [Stenomitos sp.]